MKSAFFAIFNMRVLQTACLLVVAISLCHGEEFTTFQPAPVDDELRSQGSNSGSSLNENKGTGRTLVAVKEKSQEKTSSRFFGPYAGGYNGIYPGGIYGMTPFQGGFGYGGYPGYSTGYGGYPGAIGYPGSVGAVGYPGSVGAIGYPGSVGAIGYPGSVGAFGYPGSVGAFSGHNEFGYGSQQQQQQQSQGAGFSSGAYAG